MFRLLDRQLIYGYLKAYLVCLVSLLGLFVVIDLFTNLDDFTGDRRPLSEVLQHIGAYYGYTCFKIFDRLCEATALLAGMFTISWMQRNNEILPLLSAGVSARRIVRPVLVAACGMLGLAAANQELMLPNVDMFLVEDRGNRDGAKETEVKGAYERNGIHVSGRVAYKKDRQIKDFACVIPPKLGHDHIVTLQAKDAVYVPAGEQHPAVGRSGGWLLTGTAPPTVDGWTNLRILEPLSPGRYFLYTADVDFETATRPKNWHMYMPTWRLLQEILRPGNAQQSSLAVMFHVRLTRPVLGVILVCLGLSVILRDQNRNLFISAGLCLVLCVVFFVVCFTCQYLGSHEHLSPALAAWLPVLLFGPLSFVLFDAVHT
jgi:lipopolysaccharide export system permease protein